MKKIALTAAAVFFSVLLLGVQSGFAYSTWSNCGSCHPAGTPGSASPSELHGIAAHTNNCSNCHSGSPAAGNVSPSACIACHPAASQGLCPLINQSSAGASHGATCLACHTDCAPAPTTTTVPPDNTTTTVPPSATFSISGTVTCNGNPFPGVTMTLSGGANGSSVTTQTDDSGAYAFSDLADGTYTVTPSYPDRTFTPESRQVTISGASATGIDFAKTPASATTTVCPSDSGYTVSGLVTLAGSDSGLAGVTVTLSSGGSNGDGGDNESGGTNGSALMTATTNDIGCYIFYGVANGTYTVTPSLTGYTFEPASRQITVSSGDVTGIDFTATAEAGTTTTISEATTTISETTTTAPPDSGFTVSGIVTLSGSGLPGVTVTLASAQDNETGDESAILMTAITDSFGCYAFSGVANGDYTVTPSLSGYTFEPASEQITVDEADVTGVDFAATASTTTTAPPDSGFTVSGTITLSGSGLAGVTVTLASAQDNASAQPTVTTDATGAFAFTGVESGEYTVTPSLQGYAFTPAEIEVEVTDDDVTDLAFTAVASAEGPYSIAGTIRRNMNRQPLAGVTVTLAGAASATAVTDSSGSYSFENLAAGRYTVRPRLEGYNFAPAVRNINITNNSVTADFVALMRLSEIIREIFDLLKR